MTEHMYHPIAWLRHLPSSFDPEEHEFPWGLPEDTAYVISDFVRNGRKIFHLEPELVRLFEKTSIDELILEDLHLPYEAFYIYFGKDAGVHAPNYGNLGDASSSPVVIEGAYVSRSLHTIRGINEGFLWVTLAPAFEEGKDENFFTYDINFELHAHPAGFIREGLKTRVVDQYLSIFENPWERMGELAWKRMERIGGNLQESFQEVKEGWKPDAKDTAWKGAATKALHIVFNAIVYLTTAEADIVEDYPEFYSKELVEKTKRVGKQTKRVSRKLENLGFKKVSFVGRGIRK